MRISGMITPQRVLVRASAPDKTAVIRALVEALAADGQVLRDPEACLQDILDREASCSTAVGGAVAVPHAKSESVIRPAVAAMTLPEGVAWDAPDGAPVRLIFLLAVPKDAASLHVQLLADLARRLMHPDFIDSLLAAQTPEEFLDAMERKDEPDAAFQGSAPEAPPPGPLVLAVTACPMGVAHTYMAAEALEQAARELGVRIQVETNGADGTKNLLTPDQIAEAACIIVAADRTVETARFAGRPVLTVGVSEAVRHPQALLRRALAGDIPPMPVPRSAAELEPALRTAPESPRHELRERGRHVYNHVMNGINHMIPFVTGGGILIALSYFLDRANVAYLTFGSGTSLAWLLGEIGNIAFDMMYPILAGFLAVAMAGPPALLPGLMGGYLAWLGMAPTSPDGWVSSSFWGALLAGAFAGYTIRGLRRLFAKLPTGLEALKTTLIYPVVGLIVVGLLMVVVVNPPLGQFNDWLYRCLESMQGGSRIALGAVLGAMMAVDFGGPVNKAAYLFGTVTLSGGQQGFMAAVMLGGMVPPLAVALACTLFPSRFSRAERNAAPMNYLMGFSFITEGALPFALRDPLRVIPSCMAGSALAGGLSTALHCGVPAPHGGLYVLPLANNWLGMLLALVAGSVVSAVLMGLLKQAAPAESAPAPDLNPEANP